MKKILLKILPESLILFLHRMIPIFYNFIYKDPSKDLIIIGVTGTKGKTTTSHIIHSILSIKYKTALITTIGINVDGRFKKNIAHQTTPRNLIKLLAIAKRNGNKYCVIETSSEGVKYNRNYNVNYDYFVFTNLSPEHIEAHKNFENYKNIKLSLFKNIKNFHNKHIDGNEIKKTIIVNKDDAEYKDFLKYDADKKITYALEAESDNTAIISYRGLKYTDFTLDKQQFRLKLFGDFNVLNTIPGIIIGKLEGVEYFDIYDEINNLEELDGRVNLTVHNGVNIFIDYAHESKSIEALLKNIKNIVKDNQKIIIIFGGVGGGRDKSHRKEIPKIVSKFADTAIITNVDPVEEEPMDIINELASYIKNNITVLKIEDRKKAIKKAIDIAKRGDFILITGKGHEVSMILKDKEIYHSDSEVLNSIINGYKN